MIKATLEDTIEIILDDSSLEELKISIERKEISTNKENVDEKEKEKNDE